MTEFLENTWVVAISNYESPSRYAVWVEPAATMVRENIDAFKAGNPHTRYSVLGLFPTEEEARTFGAVLQHRRNERIDVLHRLLGNPEE
ncbi:hypothetical protein [Cupriavidus sp. a3]|uniref:hypothetical protein n=1 Tax=Cupriavidus sp. a3 TaxID=3242158 RepID=UPI003D9C38B9